MSPFRLAAAALLALAPSLPAAAQLPSRAINTGGAQGAYHTLFCPPLPTTLAAAYFQGYQCTPSAGTLENITRVLATPTQIGFAQLDVFAREAARRAEEFKRLTIIRQDLACEGLWMVTRNTELTNFGEVLGLARRIPFILPPEASGASASFAFLQQIDPEGLGRVPAGNIRRVADATAVINAVAEASDGAVGFFVQFADPQNANMRLMAEKNLRVIPVVSREILRARVGDQQLYQVQGFTFSGSGVFSRSRELTTACTPVAIFTGAPSGMPAGQAREDQQEVIQRIRALPVERVLPQESRVARLISGARRLSGQAVEEMTNAVDSGRRAIEQRMR